MDKLVFYAVVFGLTIAGVGITLKVDLLRPQRVWLNCLFWTVWGVILLVSLDLLTHGFDSGIQPSVHVILAFVGALGGAICGLLLSFMSFLERRSAH